MTGNQWIVVLTAIGTVVVIATFIWTVRRAAKDDATKDAREKAELEGQAYSRGALSRNDEVALLKSQRDDARRERDQLRGERDDWQNRYLNLRDSRGDH